MQWHGLRINQRVITTEQIKSELLIPVGTKGLVIEYFVSAQLKKSNHATIRFKGDNLTLRSVKCISPVKNKRKRLGRKQQNAVE